MLGLSEMRVASVGPCLSEVVSHMAWQSRMMVELADNMKSHSCSGQVDSRFIKRRPSLRPQGKQQSSTSGKAQIDAGHTDISMYP